MFLIEVGTALDNPSSLVYMRVRYPFASRKSVMKPRFPPAVERYFPLTNRRHRVATRYTVRNATVTL